ncbi:hypothetical protein ACLGIH_33680 [Streptomyces sp. HMX87]|uniref:hypothetical protein n=1 Tax=Streptomyces sp. HMX87 TaxID=3390849 RepID=UPI003A85C64F
MTMRDRTSLARRCVIGGTVLALTALTACGGGGGDDKAGGGAEGSCRPSSGKVTLDYWSWVPGMQKAVDVWYAKNPDIQVKLKTTPAGNAGTYQNMSNVLKAGKAPDLGQVEYDSLASFRLKEGPDGHLLLPRRGGGREQVRRLDLVAGGVRRRWRGRRLGPAPGHRPDGPVYRKDVYDKLGHKAPTTVPHAGRPLVPVDRRAARQKAP